MNSTCQTIKEYLRVFVNYIHATFDGASFVHQGGKAQDRGVSRFSVNFFVVPKTQEILQKKERIELNNIRRNTHRLVYILYVC